MNSYSTSWWSLLLINLPREDERLSWPCWLWFFSVVLCLQSAYVVRVCLQCVSATILVHAMRSVTSRTVSARVCPTRTVVSVMSVNAATTATQAVGRVSAMVVPTTVTAQDSVCHAVTSPGETTARGLLLLLKVINNQSWGEMRSIGQNYFSVPESATLQAGTFANMAL